MFFLLGVLIPESPPEPDWENKMCTRINYHRKAGRKLNIIIVAEGAIDKQGLSIKTQYIKDVSLID